MLVFLRRCERKKSGKRHTYWALVESVRTAKGSRHRTVAYLGELKKGEQNGWAQLVRRLNRQQRPEPSLFDPPYYDEPGDDEEPVLVKLKDIRLERLRDFGDVWLALGLWRLMEMDKLLAKLMPAGREEVAWDLVAAILTIARFCKPSSELHIADTWYRQTALEDLLGVTIDQVTADRLYAGLDHLWAHKEAIESHLRNRLGDLFGVDYELLLYDVTSTYFEGQCNGNPKAKHGHSRDHRPDCKQVCIGLVVTPEGLPLGFEVFEGNKHDSKTVETIVLAIEKKYGQAGRVWVLDRGMVSESNLTFLRERGNSYVVGTPRAMLRRFEAHLTEKGWTEVQAGVEVKQAPGPEGEETFILVRSQERQAKEKAIHDRFVERFEAKLKKLEESAQSGRLRDATTAYQRLGRLKQRYSRASGAFDVTIKEVRGADGKQTLSISYARNVRWAEWTRLSEGCYLLRSNLKEVDAKWLWDAYLQLVDAEWAFRICKDELVIRPVWHHKEDRVNAHILVCFLAYVLWKALSRWMKGGGLGDAPRTLVEELAKIKSGDVILPAKLANGTSRTVRLRCVTTPEAPQKVLLNRLGVTLPQRLRRIDEIEQM